MKSKIPARLLLNPVHCLSLGFGSGLAPKAPGTFGSVVGLILYFFLQNLNHSLYILFVVIGFFIGIWLCGQTAQALKVHDHPGIVWDEIVGIWLTLFLLPAGWQWILGGFVLFRLFDIWKPWPIKYIDEKVRGGLGIMLDDILAALFAFFSIQIIAYLLYS